MVTKVKKCNFHVNFPVKHSLGYSNFHNLLKHESSWKSLSVTFPFTFWRVSIQNILNMNNSSAVCFCSLAVRSTAGCIYAHFYLSIQNILKKCASSTLAAASHLPLMCSVSPRLFMHSGSRHAFKWCLCVARADKADLQEEAGALRHGGEGRDGRHRR